MSAVVLISVKCDWQDCAIQYFAPGSATVRGARTKAEKSGWGTQHMAGGMHPKNSTDRKGDDLCPKHYREFRGVPENEGLFEFTQG